MRALILGANGLIGSTMLKVFSEKFPDDTIGTIRDDRIKVHFPKKLFNSLVSNIDMMNKDTLSKLFHEIKPDVVINCTGITKHLKQASDPIIAISMNALLPHQLSRL
ncbi:MAG: NAD-dependent epimerase/dehydratase family protein, partial [Rhodomicrobiaceae bacterium]